MQTILIMASILGVLRFFYTGVPIPSDSRFEAFSSKAMASIDTDVSHTITQAEFVSFVSRVSRWHRVACVLSARCVRCCRVPMLRVIALPSPAPTSSDVRVCRCWLLQELDADKSSTLTPEELLAYFGCLVGGASRALPASLDECAHTNSRGACRADCGAVCVACVLQTTRRTSTRTTPIRT
jgi:hypothetical protein